MKKYILILICLMILSLNAYAECPEGILACGDDCGTDCSWSIATDGTLSVWGNGEQNNGQIGTFDTIVEDGKTIGTTAPWGTYISNINNVEIEEGITNLGRYAFGYIQSQNPIEIPSTVASVSSGAFYRVRAPEVVISENVDTINYQAFAWSFIENATIPQNVTSIGNDAFRGSTLTDIIIPNSVTTIGARAFSVCPDLQSIIIGDNVTTIAKDAFIGTPAYVYCQNTADNPNRCRDLMTNSGLES
ncbi:MAG: leucine-rich repeat domain-containing protein, partial [Alphaproteobacteria bacterium]|nr:leucine-rich repeat domain-containing protein [Alphaproteobacteria bacterium]